MKLGPGIVLLWNASHRYHPFTLDSILTDSYGTRIIVKLKLPRALDCAGSFYPFLEGLPYVRFGEDRRGLTQAVPSLMTNSSSVEPPVA